MQHSPNRIKRELLKALAPAVQARVLLEALAGVGAGEPGCLKLVRDLAPKRFISGLWEAEANIFGTLMMQMDLAQLRVLEGGLAAVDSPEHGVSDPSLLVIRSLCAEFIDGIRLNGLQT